MSFLSQVCSVGIQTASQNFAVQSTQTSRDLGKGYYRCVKLFLSPPVLMHGRLLCITFPLPVCLSYSSKLLEKKVHWKNELEKKFKDHKSRPKFTWVKCHMISACYIGRLAHIHIKLLHVLHDYRYQDS